MVRVVWAVSALFGGATLVLYVIMWLIVPEKGLERTVADDIVDSLGSEEAADEEQ